MLTLISSCQFFPPFSLNWLFIFFFFLIFRLQPAASSINEAPPALAITPGHHLSTVAHQSAPKRGWGDGTGTAPAPHGCGYPTLSTTKRGKRRKSQGTSKASEWKYHFSSAGSLKGSYASAPVPKQRIIFWWTKSLVAQFKKTLINLSSSSCSWCAGGERTVTLREPFVAIIQEQLLQPPLSTSAISHAEMEVLWASRAQILGWNVPTYHSYQATWRSTTMPPRQHHHTLCLHSRAISALSPYLPTLPATKHNPKHFPNTAPHPNNPNNPNHATSTAPSSRQDAAAQPETPPSFHKETSVRAPVDV